MQALTNYINEMSDSGSGNAPRHNFCDLMTISLLCAISGRETAVDMENFGKSKEEFLRQFLDLPHGIPCHDAYSRLFRMIKPDSFQAFFDKFRADFSAAAKENPAIALDGKEMRRSFDKASNSAGFIHPTDQRYEVRTVVERVNGRLRDDFGARHLRVRGHKKVYAHLMFGVIALCVDQIVRLLN